MEEKHGDEHVNDLTSLVEADSQGVSNQGATSELSDPGGFEDDDLPTAKGKARIGELLYNKYRIVGLIAKGGMGEVYKARVETSDKLVAIKVLSAKLTKRKESLYRFMREVSSVAALKHPNLIAVSDIGLLADGCPYYVMEYIEGESLANILIENGRLKPERAKEIFIQLSSALAAAHALGFIHRDIKPSNILIREGADGKDEVKLVDFGIAKRDNETEDSQRLTSKGTVFGSPLYMSPEQCEGKITDARSDVYSACCTMYECLNGKPPFRGDTPLQTMSMHKNDSPNPLSMNDELGALLEKTILKGLAKEPDDRFQNAQEILDALMGKTIEGKTQKQNEEDSQPQTNLSVSSDSEQLSKPPELSKQPEKEERIIETLQEKSRAAISEQQGQNFLLSPTGVLLVLIFIALCALFFLMR